MLVHLVLLAAYEPQKKCTFTPTPLPSFNFIPSSPVMPIDDSTAVSRPVLDLGNKTTKQTETRMWMHFPAQPDDSSPINVRALHLNPCRDRHVKKRDRSQK